MFKVISVILVVTLCAKSAFSNAFDDLSLPCKMSFVEDFKWSMSVMDTLCGLGRHNDTISKGFYACYNDAIIPVSEFAIL